MTDKQTIVMLDLLLSKIAASNHHVYELMMEDGISEKYFPKIIQSEIIIKDCIDTLKPDIVLCRCGNEMNGKRNLCHECRKRRL